jgi:hypothetical protein
MQAEGMTESWLKEMPYLVCSIDDFEMAIQVIGMQGIGKVLKGKAFDADKQEWLLGAYMEDSFKRELGETRFLFLEEFDQFIEKRIPGVTPSGN